MEKFFLILRGSLPCLTTASTKVLVHFSNTHLGDYPWMTSRPMLAQNEFILS